MVLPLTDGPGTEFSGALGPDLWNQKGTPATKLNTDLKKILAAEEKKKDEGLEKYLVRAERC